MTLAATLAVSLTMLAWVGYPLIAKTQRTRLASDRQMSEQRVRALLASLEKLRENRDAGKIAGDDFENIERGLLLQLAKLYRELDIAPLGSETETAETGDEEGAEPVKQPLQCACGAPLRDFYHYCANCGRKVAA